MKQAGQQVPRQEKRATDKKIKSSRMQRNEPFIKDFGWRGCFDQERKGKDSTVVNLTPWGLFSKGTSSRYNLDVCYGYTAQVERDIFLSQMIHGMDRQLSNHQDDLP